MRLKRLRVFGFKTFADRTELDIDADLIAIVGPNGCGKSNIVDAILWGLGEPNVRNIRAAHSQDVIFNGSSKRKPIGYAEVTLVFDNEDGHLPIDTAEVSISRRLTRAGDSQYSINKRNCRQKDIFDLLADSGLGKSGYAIVGQREIDQALSASDEDRRAWIDEAAGVQRFRTKRLEALRRLDEADTHLERLTSLRGDLDMQRDPLREEAELAEQYIRVRDALAEVEISLLVTEIRRSDSDLEALAARLQESVEGMHKANREADELDEQRIELGEELAELERKLDALRELRQAKLTAAERAEASVRLAQQKLESLKELEQNFDEDRQKLDRRRSELLAELEQEEALREEQGIELETAKRTLGGSNEQVTRFNRELAEIDGRIRVAQQSENERLRIVAEQRQAAERLKVIEEEVEGAGHSLPELEQAIHEAELEADVAKHSLAAKETELQKLQEAVRVEQRQHAELEAQYRKLIAEIASSDGRRRGIEATLEAHEGLTQGATAVLNFVKQGQLPDHYAPIAEALEAESDHALAIETALGGAAHDLIVPHERDAKAAIELLKERRLGRATFQPLNLIRGDRRPMDLGGLKGKSGVIGVASNLVECQPDHRPVVDALLGRVVIVDTLDTALALANTLGWSRLVTLDGEVVHSAGAVTGGKTNRQNSGIVQRKAELARLVDHIETLQEGADGLRSQIGRHDEDQAKRTIAIQETEEQINPLRTELGERQTWLHKLKAELQTTQRELDRLLSEKQKLVEIGRHEIPTQEDLSGLVELRDGLLANLAKHGAEKDAGLQRLKDLDDQARRCDARIKDLRQKLDQSDHHDQHRAQRISNMEHERQGLAALIEDQGKIAVHCQKEAESCAAEGTRYQQEKQDLMQKNLHIIEQTKDAQQRARVLGDRIRQTEVERARTESRRANAVQRLLEEYSLDLEDLDESKILQDLPEDAAQVAGRLRRELKGMGTPNLGAIEAFKKVDEKWTELTAQLEDLELSKQDILTALEELDRLTRDRFVGAFEAVRVKFKENFLKLFEGGEADLALTDPIQPLNSGVTIDVALPGKKRQRLELLSGGERSLCGCAFLFALLSVKPSPLVVLDEVDAPLDGRNVERFIEALGQFRTTTQFLIITHNPVTIEAAPVWFGVTMKEPGVSTVLPFQAPGPGEEIVQAVVHDAFLIPSTS